MKLETNVLDNFEDYKIAPIEDCDKYVLELDTSKKLL